MWRDKEIYTNFIAFSYIRMKCIATIEDQVFRRYISNKGIPDFIHIILYFCPFPVSLFITPSYSFICQMGIQLIDHLTCFYQVIS